MSLIIRRRLLLIQAQPVVPTGGGGGSLIVGDDDPVQSLIRIADRGRSSDSVTACLLSLVELFSPGKSQDEVHVAMVLASSFVDRGSSSSGARFVPIKGTGPSIARVQIGRTARDAIRRSG